MGHNIKNCSSTDVRTYTYVHIYTHLRQTDGVTSVNDIGIYIRVLAMCLPSTEQLRYNLYRVLEGEETCKGF